MIFLYKLKYKSILDNIINKIINIMTDISTQDFLDKLAMLLRGYNVDILGYHNMSIVNTSQEEIYKEQARLYERIRDIQYKIHIRGIQFFCGLNFELNTTLALLKEYINFDKLVIINVNNVITTFKNKISIEQAMKKFKIFH